MVTVTESGIDESMIGGNKSAEAGDEDFADDEQTVSGIDVVMNCKLEKPMPYDKKSFGGYLKGYSKA